MSDKHHAPISPSIERVNTTGMSEHVAELYRKIQQRHGNFRTAPADGVAAETKASLKAQRRGAVGRSVGDSVGDAQPPQALKHAAGADGISEMQAAGPSFAWISEGAAHDVTPTITRKGAVAGGRARLAHHEVMPAEPTDPSRPSAAAVVRGAIQETTAYERLERANDAIDDHLHHPGHDTHATQEVLAAAAREQDAAWSIEQSDAVARRAGEAARAGERAEARQAAERRAAQATDAAGPSVGPTGAGGFNATQVHVAPSRQPGTRRGGGMHDFEIVSESSGRASEHAKAVAEANIQAAHDEEALNATVALQHADQARGLGSQQARPANSTYEDVKAELAHADIVDPNEPHIQRNDPVHNDNPTGRDRP